MSTLRGTELSVEVEKKSSILRTMKVKVPAKVVKSYFDEGVAAAQKTAKLKGFRPGHVPVNVIKQYYGEDIRHRVFHTLIDDSFDLAVKKEELKTVGRPQISTPDHKTGEGDHDHTLHEEQDLSFEATFEVMPEVAVKGYTGLSLTQDKVDVAEEHVEKVVDNLRNSQAQLESAGGGLALADGTQSSRPVEKGDFVDAKISGGLVTETGVQARDDMKGDKLIEVGSNSWIPGFEENLVGMRQGEIKTFRVTFPKDFTPELSEKTAEFTVTVNEVKVKKLPVLDDEFAKQMGYESLTDLRDKAREYLVKERTEDSDRKLRSDLLAQIIEKNTFDVPAALIESQTRALAQEWAQELKNQGFQEKMIEQTIMPELDNIKKRAEGQVRASLLLESIAKEEKIEVSPADLEAEKDKLATGMKVERSQLDDYYAKNPGRMLDLEFRLRQERTIRFLLDKAKIKSVSPTDK